MDPTPITIPGATGVAPKESPDLDYVQILVPQFSHLTSNKGHGDAETRVHPALSRAEPLSAADDAHASAPNCRYTHDTDSPHKSHHNPPRAPVGRNPWKVGGPHHAYGDIFNVDPVTGCWVWARALDYQGYGIFRRDNRTFKAHRHFYRAYKGEIPAGLVLDHLCRNRACVNPAHLEAVPQQTNARRGLLCSTGMNLEKAQEMRRLRAQGVAHKELATRFGVSKNLVAQIVTNRCWLEPGQIIVKRSPLHRPSPALPAARSGVAQ